MADPVSIALKSAGLALTICKATYDLGQGMRKAPEEIRRVAADMKGFYGVLGALSNSIESHRSSLETPGTLSYHLENISSLLEDAVAVFRDVQERLQSFVAGDGKVKKGVWERLQWETMEKDEVRQTRIHLSNIKLSLNIALSTLTLVIVSSTNEQISVMHAHVLQVQQDLQQLRDRLDVARRSRLSLEGEFDPSASRLSIVSMESVASRMTVISMEDTMADFVVHAEAFVIQFDGSESGRAEGRQVDSTVKSWADETLEAIRDKGSWTWSVQTIAYNPQQDAEEGMELPPSERCVPTDLDGHQPGYTDNRRPDTPVARPEHAPEQPTECRTPDQFTSAYSGGMLENVPSTPPPTLANDTKVAARSTYWATKLGHANFHITPEPYYPDDCDLNSCERLRKDWASARREYNRVAAHVSEHYGPTSHTCQFTEQKWAEIDNRWRSYYERANAEACAHGMQDRGLVGVRHAESVAESSLGRDVEELQGDTSCTISNSSTVADEQLLPEPQECARGDSCGICGKWRKEQQLLARLVGENGIDGRAIGSVEGNQPTLYGDNIKPVTDDMMLVVRERGIPKMDAGIRQHLRSRGAQGHTDSPREVIHATHPVQSTEHRLSAISTLAHPVDEPGTARPTPSTRPADDMAAIFVVVALFSFSYADTVKQLGYPYLPYVQGDIFDVIVQKGELWLAKNQDDRNNSLGWLWEQHFAILSQDPEHGFSVHPRVTLQES